MSEPVRSAPYFLSSGLFGSGALSAEDEAVALAALDCLLNEYVDSEPVFRVHHRHHTRVGAHLKCTKDLAITNAMLLSLHLGLREGDAPVKIETGDVHIFGSCCRVQSVKTPTKSRF